MLVRNLRPDTGEIEYSETRDRPGTSGLAGSGVPILTTAQRDALAGANLYRFLTILNSTTGGIEVYYGATTGWKPPWNTAWGEAGYAELGSGALTVTTTEADITGLSTTVTTVANRKLLILSRVRFTFAASATWVKLVLQEAGVQIDFVQVPISSGQPGTAISEARSISAGGAVTYQLRANTDAGSASPNGSATGPQRLVVHDIGPNGSSPAA